MLFDFNHYSSFLLIFFVHGLVYAGLLAQRAVREGRRADGWLSLFLFLCSLYIAPWMLGFAGWYDEQPYRNLLFYVPFQQLFAIGPLVYFYVQSLLNPSFRFTRKEALHLVPPALYLLFSVIVFCTDRLVLHEAWFLRSGHDPDFDDWYQGLGFASMLWYAVRSLRYYRLFRGLMLQVTSYADRIQFTWVRLFLQVFLAMLALRTVFFVISFFINTDYAGTWWYFLGFALLFYVVAIKGYANAAQATVAYRALPDQKAVLLLPAAGMEEGFIADEEAIDMATPAPEENEELETWKSRIAGLVENEKLYSDPELNLSTLSRRLGIPAAQLSRLINKGFCCNFNDFINGYRVRAVQQQLRAGAHLDQTLVSVAYDCGFNSKATFNRAFGKHTGTTPTAFLKTLG